MYAGIFLCRDDDSYMHVLITGGAGFIASHVANALHQQHPEYHLVVLDRMSYAANAAHLLPGIHLERGNICHESTVKRIFEKHTITHVLHFAAETHVDNSFLDSLPFTIANVVGTDVLLRQSRRTPGFQRFVHVSTDEVYGECKHGSFDETAPLAPSNPYSASKAGAELLVQSYMQSFGFPAVISRANNIYGPHQYPEKLIPKLLLRGMAGQSFTLHGSGSSVRNYLYVSDAARAFGLVLHHGELGHIYNISGTQEYSTRQVAEALQQIFLAEGRPAPPLEHVRDRAFNDCRYSVSSGKLQLLGWQPSVGLEAGLRQCFAWYQQHRSRYARLGLEPHPMQHPDLIEKNSAGLDASDPCAPCAPGSAPPCVPHTKSNRHESGDALATAAAE